MYVAREQGFPNYHAQAHAGCRVCPNIHQQPLQGSLHLLALPEVRAGGAEPHSESWKTYSGFLHHQATSLARREMLIECQPGIAAERCGQGPGIRVEVGGFYCLLFLKWSKSGVLPRLSWHSLQYATRFLRAEK